MKWFLAAVTVFMLAGCGSGVDWFPENGGGGGGSAPDGFTFTPKTNVAVNTTVQSESVTVTGTSGSIWTISVSGAPGSAYSINGAAFTSSPGTIKPDQSLVVQHMSSSTNNTVTTTSVKVGTYTTSFQATTVPL